MKKEPTAGPPADNPSANRLPANRDEPPGDPAYATSLEQILRSSPDIFRAVLQRISPAKEPARWAGEQLKLGAVLRLRSQQESGLQRAAICCQTIEAFEAALCIYCRCGVASEGPDADKAPDLQPANLSASTDETDPVDLVLEFTSQPFIANTEPLDEALIILRSRCTRAHRSENFNTWAVNMINLACTLTLLGKCAGCEGDSSWLEEAIDTFRALLSERFLRDIPYEHAIVHINLADALRSMGEIAFPDERLEYLESAVSSLATALSLVAPQTLRCLVEANSICFM